MTAKFIIKRTEGGRYFFELRAPNYQIIVKSVYYESLSGVMNGIEGVKKYANNAETISNSHYKQTTT